MQYHVSDSTTIFKNNPFDTYMQSRLLISFNKFFIFLFYPHMKMCLMELSANLKDNDAGVNM